MPMTIKAENTRRKQFIIVRSMQKNQNQVIYQGSTIWFFEKLSLKIKYLKACIDYLAS